MEIDYDHSKNAHDLPGPRAAFGKVFEKRIPRSLLDVGCGTGTWLKAAYDSGVTDIFGVDGVEIPSDRFAVSRSFFSRQNLTESWKLGRRFDVAICLEVAEHLDAQYAQILIDTLTEHSDCIIFSAACPGQNGQHHVNCQWPAYWQKLFNERGYACSDAVRWKIWTDERIEVWYRQNMFEANRDETRAGNEPRILPVIHPDHINLMMEAFFNGKLKALENGWMPFAWYLSSLVKAFKQKALKKWTRT